MGYNYKKLMESLQDGVYFVDENRKITYWNKAAEKITGFLSSEVVGSSCMEDILLHVDEEGESLCQGACPLAAAMKNGTAQQTEVYLHHKRGHRVPVWMRTAPLRDDDGHVIGGAELFSDISTQKAMQERIKELEKLSLIDGLTGLSNRRHFEGELAIRFQEQQRYGLDFGILFMDIDHFKQVNDTYGHDGGDAVIKTVADTFKASARSYDLFARWGGEEFVGIIRNVDRPLLAKIGERFRVLVEKTRITWNHTTFSVTVSVGAAFSTPRDSSESLIKRADELMYQSKQNGRNRLTIETGDE